MTKIEKECIAKRIKAIKNVRKAYIETSGMSETLQKENNLELKTDGEIIMKALDSYFSNEMEDLWCLFDHIDCKTPEAFGADHIEIDNPEELPFN